MTNQKHTFAENGDIACPHCDLEVPLLNKGLYKLGASGAGIIVFEKLSPTKVRLLLTKRTALVGAGLGITGGGYIELGDIAAMDDFTIVDTAEGAYRENVEENLGFGELFTLESFLEAAQPMAQLQVSTPVTVHDKSGVHTTNFYGINSTTQTFEAIADLKGNDERSGDLIETILEIGDTRVSRSFPEMDVHLSINGGKPLVASDFYHRHELRAIASIGWHLQEDYLRRSV